MLSAAPTALLVACITAGVAATPIAAVSNATTTAREPCAVVSSSLAAIKPSQTPAVLAEVAYACLQSVPVDTEGNKNQLEGLSNFLQWQSTLTYLKNPPPGYLYDGVDLLGGLVDLSDKLASDQFDSEYDFQLAVYNLIVSAHDGHLDYQPDITSVFRFGRPYQLLSLSEDGTSLPEIYVAEDQAVLRSTGNASHSYTPSPLVSIQGVPVEEVLNLQANLTGGAQDPDSNYNALFYSAPKASIGSSPNLNWYLSVFYAGPTTTFVFKNGTNTTLPNIAIFNSANFEGVIDGETFFEKFCTGPVPTNETDQATNSTSTSNSASTASTSSVVTSIASFTPVPTTSKIKAPTGYPTPVIIHSGGYISGYLPTDSDVAVLAVPSFETPSTGEIEFGNVAREFIATAKAANKTKLIVDLRGNGGGRVMLGYGLFRILFPDRDIYSGFNIRASPLFDKIGQSLSTYYQDYDVNNLGLNASATEDLATGIFSTIFNYQNGLNASLESFASWSDFFGPRAHYGDNFTSVARYNFSNPIATGFIPIDDTNNGFTNLTNSVPASTFAPEDIVLLQDGYCASTCATFSEAMKTEAGVRQIAIGGRPQEGPMQGVGGVKGSEVYTFTTIQSVLEFAAEDDTTANQAEYWNTTVLPLSDSMQHALNRSAYSAKTEDFSAQLNFKNSIRRGDEVDATPLQFVYEAADCRLFFTADMYHDPTYIWSAVYASIWGNGSCVKGSTGHPSSVSGAVLLAEPPKGANDTSGNGTGSSSTTSGTITPYVSSGGAVRMGVAGWTIWVAAVVALVVSL